jgi:ferredoxin
VPNLQPDYVFAIAVNGGQVANTLVQLKKALARYTITLAAGWGITMPSNYIPWGGPGPQDQQQKLFESARGKIVDLADKIQKRSILSVETGPLWQRMIFSGLAHPMSAPHIPRMDKRFWVDEKCNHCEICQKVCPADNITIQDGKPVWNQHCEQCFACLQWCPQEAIQYGKNTPKYERYHHPEVTLKDIVQSRR